MAEELTCPWSRQLRARGYRLTPQRRSVLQILERGDHVTVEDIAEQLESSGMPLDRPTVYRVLQTLKEAGIVSQTDLGGKAAVYQFVVRSQPHHHLVCLSCGSTQELDDRYFAPLRATLADEMGFQARIEHQAVFGRCAACAKLPADESSR